MEKEMNKLKVPETDSIAELATFWDTHDLTDYEDELEEVTEPVFQHGVETIAVPLQPQEIQAVRRIAESQGVDYIALIQGWVLEKLHST
jgi:predicted DNA binding CopG/RHH family protein